MITPLDLNFIHLRSRKVIHHDYPIIIEEPIEEGNPNKKNNNNSSNAIKQTCSCTLNQPQLSKTHSFSERLTLDKKIKQFEYDL
jgi:hypothetical protein